VSYLNSGEYERAAGELSVAVAIQPENIVVLRYLGSAYARDNKLERARRVLQAAIDLAPSDPAARYEMAQVALAAGDLDGAERESKKTVELDPGNLRAQELVGSHPGAAGGGWRQPPGFGLHPGPLLSRPGAK
jgi:Flp pilus assembly protein TadD